MRYKSSILTFNGVINWWENPHKKNSSRQFPCRKFCSRFLQHIFFLHGENRLRCGEMEIGLLWKWKKKKNYATNGLCSIKKKLCGYVVLRVIVWVKSLRMCLWARKKYVRNSSMTHTNVQQRCNSDVREHMSVRLATTCAPFLRLSISNWFFFSLTIDAIFYFYLRWLQTYRQIVSVVKASCLLFLFADLVFFFICNIWHKCNAKCYTEGKFLNLILKILLSVFFFFNFHECIWLQFFLFFHSFIISIVMWHK